MAQTTSLRYFKNRSFKHERTSLRMFFFNGLHCPDRVLRRAVAGTGETDDGAIVVVRPQRTQASDRRFHASQRPMQRERRATEEWLNMQ